MEKSINPNISLLNKMGKTFNKILMLLTLILLSLVSVNASVVFEDDQTITIPHYNSASIIASSSPALAFDSMSDVSYNFQLSTKPIYLVLSAGSGNPSENISISYYDGVLDSFITKNYAIPDETFIVELTPQDVGDDTTLILSNATGNIFYSYVFSNDDERTLTNRTTIFTPLINGIVDLVVINVALWKLAFYVVIFAFVIGTLVLLMWLVIKFYKWGKEHNVFKKRSNHR